MTEHNKIGGPGQISAEGAWDLSAQPDWLTSPIMVYALSEVWYPGF